MAIPLSGGKSGADVRAFYTVKSGDWGGVQAALPSVGANGTSDLNVNVSRNFRPNAPVYFARPSGTADPGGISIAAVDCIAPATPFGSGGHPRIRIRFSNGTAGALTPATQQYDFYQD